MDLSCMTPIDAINELYKLPLSAIKAKQEIIFKELGI